MRTSSAVAALVLAAGAALVAGCSGEQEPAVVVPDGAVTGAAPSDAPPGETSDGGGATPGPAPTRGPATDAGGAPPAPAPTQDEGPASLRVVAEPPSDDAQREVWQAYVDFWAEDVAVLSDPARPTEDLGSRLAEPQLRRTTEYVEGQRAAGLRSTGEVVLDPQVVGVSADVAAVTDCLDDRGLVAVDAASGEVDPSTAGDRVPVEVELRSYGSGWLVADLRPGEEAVCGDSGTP